jgi:uncharacterized protein (DUF433 family)
MTVHDRIDINPKIMLGKPVIRGTRIPVELIVRKMAEGADENCDFFRTVGTTPVTHGG